MSEANVLNPVAGDTMSPEYGYRESLGTVVAQAQTRGGKAFSRLLNARGRVFELEWRDRLLADAAKLKQWHQQYESGFFSLADWEFARYYSGRFTAPPVVSPAGNNRWNISATFVELPGLAMFAYPVNWARDAIFIEERNDFAEDVIRKVGAAWAYAADANAHGGASFTNTGIDNTQYAEFLYFGYGFRVYSAKKSNYGIVAVSVDGAAETNVDLYSAGTVAAAVVYTDANQKLGFHRVKLRATNTKNAASSAFVITADAIEVMR